MKRMGMVGRVSLLLGLLLVGIGAGQAWATGSTRAVADINGCSDENIGGFASLRERRSSEGVKLVDITLVVTGLSDGKHAVHLHQTAACTPCGAAGGHFDPGPNSNTSPDGNHPFHMGDLINIRSHNGFAVLHTTTSRVTLSPGVLSLFDDDGSAFIVHTNEDTYCPDGVVAGCAGGSRDACGIITLVP